MSPNTICLESTCHHNLTHHNKGCCTPCKPKRGNQNNKPEQNNTPNTFMLCCARGVAKFPASLSSRGLSIVARKQCATQHVGNIKNCSGCWAKTTLKSTMDVNHKNEMKKSFRNVHATPLSSVCGQSINPNCSSFPAHTQHCRNLHTFTSASHQMRQSSNLD